MIDEIKLLNQVGFLCNNSAEQLYNLALFAIGDKLFAEEITIDAFAETFKTITDKSNVNVFKLQCAKKIYRNCKRGYRTVTYNICDALLDDDEDPRIVKRQKLLKLLSMHDFNDRFILLLFCQQRFSVKQVSEVIEVPVFLVRKRFCEILNLAGKNTDCYD